MKFPSDFLKEFNWNISTTFNQAKKNGFIVGVADNQLFRTIRDIRGKIVDISGIKALFEQRKEISKKYGKTSKEYEEIQYNINKNMFMSDIITIEIKHIAHYKYLSDNGFFVENPLCFKNPVKYMRLSCSAGQARKSTVLFCNVEIIDEIKKRLDNNRDKTIPIAPNKYNAYFGLYTSGTKIVTEPRFVVVPDYNNTVTFKANWCNETDWNLDDEIIEKEITLDMCRTDGMGLISPQFAQQWSKDIGLEYNCCNFVVRQSFLKGLLTTFDFIAFCKEKNNGNYIIKSSYKDEYGNNILVDLRNIDVIISESQFKLWNSYHSQEEYVQSCRDNHLYWGVSQYSKESPEDILTLNYQFIQTLNLSEQDVHSLCSKFLKWQKSICYDDPYKAILYLLGTNISQKKINNYLTSSTENWIKCLIGNPATLQDKYIKEKIYYYTKDKIKKACLGEIIENGNFQHLITDPFAYMQSICGLQVTGLLNKNEQYSCYWNNKKISRVDSMRSPMTYRSEHICLNLQKNEETEKWYKYITNGIIINWYGNEVVRYAGADFDGDLLATTDNIEMIKGIYSDELPVAYEAPKATKIIPKYQDLCNADIFTFGSKIGQITNKGTIVYTLLPEIKNIYGENSEEYLLLISRLKQACVAQSKQIDKGKIGKAVKAIPNAWVDKQIILEDDTLEQKRKKEILNRCLLSKRPYFFRYKYKETNRDYVEYKNRNNNLSKMKWGMTFKELESFQDKTDEQSLFVKNYYKYSPVIESDSTMNILCKYVEKEAKEIKFKVKEVTEFDYNIYKFQDIFYTQSEFNKILTLYKSYSKDLSDYLRPKVDFGFDFEGEYIEYISFLEYIEQENIDERKVVNALLDYFYNIKPKANKNLLWKNFGDIFFQNCINYNNIYIPIKDENGEITYLNQKYTLEKLEVDKNLYS